MSSIFRKLSTAILLANPAVVHAQQPASAEQVYVVVDEMPRFKSDDLGTKTLITYLTGNTRYPVEALIDKATGRVFVSFVVNQEGQVEQAKVVKKVHRALDKEALRVVSEMPRWEKPGRQLGQAVSVALTVPIIFNMRDATPTEARALIAGRSQAVATAQKQLTTAQEQLTLDAAASQATSPVFTADPLGVLNYISRQLQYPLDARRAGKKGQVLVSFVVTAEGNVAEVRVTKGIFPSLDAEALRVIGSLPRWQPATRGGQPVATPFTEVPVNFQL